MTPLDRIALVMQAADGRADLQPHALAFIAAITRERQQHDLVGMTVIAPAEDIPKADLFNVHSGPPVVLSAGHTHRFIKAWRGVPQGKDQPMQIWDCACGARKFEPLDPSSGSEWIEEPGQSSAGSFLRVLIDKSTIDATHLLQQTA